MNIFICTNNNEVVLPQQDIVNAIECFSPTSIYGYESDNYYKACLGSKITTKPIIKEILTATFKQVHLLVVFSDGNDLVSVKEIMDEAKTNKVTTIIVYI